MHACERGVWSIVNRDCDYDVGGNTLKCDTNSDTETEGLAGSHTPYIQRDQLLWLCWSPSFHTQFLFPFLFPFLF